TGEDAISSLRYLLINQGKDPEFILLDQDEADLFFKEIKTKYLDFALLDLRSKKPTDWIKILKEKSSSERKFKLDSRVNDFNFSKSIDFKKILFSSFRLEIAESKTLNELGGGLRGVVEAESLYPSLSLRNISGEQQKLLNIAKWGFSGSRDLSMPLSVLLGVKKKKGGELKKGVTINLGDELVELKSCMHDRILRNLSKAEGGVFKKSKDEVTHEETLCKAELKGLEGRIRQEKDALRKTIERLNPSIKKSEEEFNTSKSLSKGKQDDGNPNPSCEGALLESYIESVERVFLEGKTKREISNDIKVSLERVEAEQGKLKKNVTRGAEILFEEKLKKKFSTLGRGTSIEEVMKCILKKHEGKGSKEEIEKAVKSELEEFKNKNIKSLYNKKSLKEAYREAFKNIKKPAALGGNTKLDFLIGMESASSDILAIYFGDVFGSQGGMSGKDLTSLQQSISKAFSETGKGFGERFKEGMEAGLEKQLEKQVKDRWGSLKGEVQEKIIKKLDPDRVFADLSFEEALKIFSNGSKMKEMKKEKRELFSFLLTEEINQETLGGEFDRYANHLFESTYLTIEEENLEKDKLGLESKIKDLGSAYPKLFKGFSLEETALESVFGFMKPKDEVLEALSADVEFKGSKATELGKVRVQFRDLQRHLSRYTLSDNSGPLKFFKQEGEKTKLNKEFMAAVKVLDDNYKRLKTARDKYVKDLNGALENSKKTTEGLKKQKENKNEELQKLLEEKAALELIIKQQGKMAEGLKKKQILLDKSEDEVLEEIFDLKHLLSEFESREKDPTFGIEAGELEFQAPAFYDFYNDLLALERDALGLNAEERPQRRRLEAALKLVKDNAKEIIPRDIDGVNTV
ncbi:hypothetical protein AB751O23_BG_00010, partial [Chlamydiales bacterium SCGC AB-751-O23]